MKNYVLTIMHLEKKYHKFAVLNDVTMSIEQGAIYGLIGKNGAGKTTLIRIISDLQKPSKGEYILYGHSYREANIFDARKRVSAIIEGPSVYLNMTAKDNLLVQKRIVGNPSENNIESLLELVGLKNTELKKVNNFSLGMRQRLGIAIALVSNPDFLILDEPINGLDPEGIIEMRELILRLNHEKGITILISSHFLDELSKVATHFGFLDHGKIVREVSKEQLTQALKKKIKIKVDKPMFFVRYLEQQNMLYEVQSENEFILYGDLNMTTFILELDKLGCQIESFEEHDETLETYYMNLIGGEDR